MALQNKTYTKSSYTLDTFEELVPLDDNFIMASLVLANDADSAIDLEVELVDESGTRLAIIVPTYNLAGKTAQVLDVRSINVTASYSLRVKASAEGVSFTASGAIRI